MNDEFQNSLPEVTGDEILIVGHPERLENFADTMAGMAEEARQTADAMRHEQQLDDIRDRTNDSLSRMATDAADLAAFSREAAAMSQLQPDPFPLGAEPASALARDDMVRDTPTGGAAGFFDGVGAFFRRLFGSGSSDEHARDSEGKSENEEEQEDAEHAGGESATEASESKTRTPHDDGTTPAPEPPLPIGGAGWQKGVVYQAGGKGGWVVADNQNAIEDHAPGMYAVWDGERTKLVGVGEKSGSDSDPSRTAIASDAPRQENGDTVTTVQERDVNGEVVTTEQREHADGSVTQTRTGADGWSSTTWGSGGDVIKTSRESTDLDGRTVKEESWEDPDGSTSSSVSRIEPDGRIITTQETENGDGSKSRSETVDHGDGTATTVSTRTEDDGSMTVFGVTNYSDGRVTTSIQQADGTVTVRETDTNGETRETIYPPASP